MEKLGDMTFAFDTYTYGVFYYDVHLSLGEEFRKIKLPRYGTAMGWIGNFGLPPQCEWLIIDQEEIMERPAALAVGDHLYKETIDYVPHPDAARHELKLTREGERLEHLEYTEDYKGAPDMIRAEAVFIHEHGTYRSNITKSKRTLAQLSGEAKAFVEQRIANHGQTAQIWHKEFTAAGSPPPIHTHRIFPELPELGIDVTKCSGTITEVGYPAGTDGIEQYFGSWYKRLEVNGAVFYIRESGLTFTEFESGEGPLKVMDSYRKELFAV